MKKYEYKFIEVERTTKKGDTFKDCKTVILQEAKNGWRLKQIITAFNEKMGLYSAMGYNIVFEKEIDLDKVNTCEK